MQKHEHSINRRKISDSIINTPSTAAKNTFFYIQEAGKTLAKENYVNSRQNLDSYLITAIVSGKGELTTGNDTFTVNSGDCFFIDCNNPSMFKCTEPCELLFTNFNGATSKQYYEFFLTQSKNVFHPQFFEKVVSVIDEIISVNEEKGVHFEAVTSKLLMELLTIAVTVSNTPEQYDSALKQKLASVYSYIEEHFSEDLSLEKLSSEFYISKFYLTREYKKIYGQTIFQHIINSRINYGKKLLRFSNKSIEEISHLCGFNDQSYFARQFKKSENLTCFAYRKKWRT